MIENMNELQPMPQVTRPEPRRFRPQTMALLAVAVVFGLLLWAKLLLVTGHPRTALADPEESGKAAEQQSRK